MIYNPTCTIIVAHDQERGIGKNGQIPWWIKEDLAYFHAMTTGHITIMGRGTWNSLPLKVRPLPNRINIVITKDRWLECTDPNIRLASSLDHALKIAQDQYPWKKIFVIGGESIYKLALQHPATTELVVTRVKAVYQCDRFFPEYEQEWDVQHQIITTDQFEINVFIKKD